MSIFKRKSDFSFNSKGAVTSTGNQWNRDEVLKSLNERIDELSREVAKKDRELRQAYICLGL